MTSGRQRWAAEEQEFFTAAGGQRSGLLSKLPDNPKIGRRRPRIPDREPRHIAAEYRRAYRVDRRRPNALVAKRLKIPQRRVTELVWLARRRGFLPPTDRGVARA